MTGEVCGNQTLPERSPAHPSTESQRGEQISTRTRYEPRNNPHAHNAVRSIGSKNGTRSSHPGLGPAPRLNILHAPEQPVISRPLERGLPDRHRRQSGRPMTIFGGIAEPRIRIERATRERHLQTGSHFDLPTPGSRDPSRRVKSVTLVLFNGLSGQNRDASTLGFRSMQRSRTTARTGDRRDATSRETRHIPPHRILQSP